MKLLETIFWKIFPFIFPIIFLSIVSIVILHYTSLEPKERIQEAVGTVIGYDKGGTSMRPAILAFSLKERQYSVFISDNYDIGEKFIVEYEEKNPKINRARLDKPVFFKNEKTSITIGIVTNYNPNYFREISFVYFVDGKKYEQSYKPIEDSNVKYPNLNEGEKYKIKYWDENPKRSIILLDEPAPN